MIVCVESNFILELAFLQEEHESCLAILDLAESNEIVIALPAFSIGESYYVWMGYSKRRKELYDNLSNVIRELSRSKPYRELSKEFLDLAGLLIKSGEEEKRRLDESVDRILNVAEIIPITLNVIRSANQYQNTLGLSPQDSVVYASVLKHLASASGESSCFITKDSSDFGNSDIQTELDGYNCKLLAGKNAFQNGLGYIRSRKQTP